RAGLHAEHRRQHSGNRAFCGVFLVGDSSLLLVLTRSRRAQLFLFRLTSRWFSWTSVGFVDGDTTVAGRVARGVFSRARSAPRSACGAATLVALLPDRFQPGGPVAFSKSDLSPADGLTKRELSGICPAAPAESRRGPAAVRGCADNRRRIGQ